MGKFKRNTAMMTNQGIDVVVNKTGEPLLRLKKHAKPLKVSSTCDKAGTSQSLYTSQQAAWHLSTLNQFVREEENDV